ncbi:MAG: ABC transporter ATP-binding protein [Firmicutes bacterium]|nr:ABC transporter ATP-binding protein [Bacillota bacterium]
MIEIKDLNFKYPNGKGVFDISFEVRKGQVVGFLGPNGAGKTTTIRCILGFVRGTTGSVTVDGLDSFNDATEVSAKIGYIAGEPAFPAGMSGREFLDYVATLRNVPAAKVEELIEYFELNAMTKIKKMSKGMKQKTAIISAIMHDPQIYILDEPTSGLDPLMQAKFIEFLKKEKQAGKTMLISSHMFEEIERTADRILIIRDGRIVKEDNVKNLKTQQRKKFIVRGHVGDLKLSNVESKLLENDQYEFLVQPEMVDKFIKALSKHIVIDIEQRVISLEEIFMHFYSVGKEVSK